MRAVYLIIGSIFALAACNGAKTNSTIIAGPPPLLLHVFNGTTVGFYNDAGGYGFKVKTASIFSVGSGIGTNQQFPQNTSDGLFYLGTTVTTGGNFAFFFNGSTGGFRSGSLVNSEQALASSGITTGLAVDPTYGHLYVSDYVNNTFYTLSASGGYIQSGPIMAPPGAGAKYMGYDTTLRRLLVAEDILGTVWAYDGANSVFLSTSPAQLTITSAKCTAPNISYVAVNSLTHLAYVLCGNAVVYLRTSGLPTYVGTSPADSTFTLAALTYGNDIVFNGNAGSVIVAGQHYVSSLDSTSGATYTSKDLMTGDCGYASMDLEALAYSITKGTLYVADATNSVIYLLDSTTLNFKNGICSKSFYSTATDVPNPKRLSFY